MITASDVQFAGSAALIIGGAWALWSIIDGQRQIANALNQLAAPPQERAKAVQLSSDIRAAQDDSKARMEEAMRQSNEAMRQVEKGIELAQRQVFLLEQVLIELRNQRVSGEPLGKL